VGASEVTFVAYHYLSGGWGIGTRDPGIYSQSPYCYFFLSFFLLLFKFCLKVHGQIKVGLCISRTNVDSQWNPVHNAFHRNFCCGNETIRQ